MTMSVHSLDGTTVPSSQDLEALASTPVLAEHAAAIKTLGRRVVTDVIEIGHRLTESRNICGHGYWLPWLDREFGWSDKTAENFINVYKLSSKFENFSNLNLPLSGLYLLAAPSTPPGARDQIIEQAKAGKSVPVAEIKQTIAEAKGRKVPSFPAIFRASKLGEDTIAKLKGTSLDSAREQDELVFLNRGASEGELTEPVRDLVACAVRGEKFSAIEYTKSGAASRREKVSASNSVPAAGLRVIIGGKTHDPTSTGETAPKDASEDLEARLKHAESQNIVLRSQVRELTRDLEAKLTAISSEQFYAELERRLSLQFLKKYQAAMKALRREFMTLDLKANPIADSEVTKH
jgi:hypothetical protein